MKTEMVKAARAYFEGAKQKHVLNALLILERPAAVAEHPDIMDSIEKELEIMAEYEDKLEILNKYFPVEDLPSKEVLNG